MNEAKLIDNLADKLNKLRLSTFMDFDYFEDVHNYEVALQDLVRYVQNSRGKDWVDKQLEFYD